MDEMQVMFSLGAIESWVEKVGTMFQVDTGKTLGHLKVVEGAFKQYRANANQPSVQPQQPQNRQATREEIEAEGEKG